MPGKAVTISTKTTKAITGNNLLPGKNCRIAQHTLCCVINNLVIWTIRTAIIGTKHSSIQFDTFDWILMCRPMARELSTDYQLEGTGNFLLLIMFHGVIIYCWNS
jgi:hypothetical protein